MGFQNVFDFLLVVEIQEFLWVANGAHEYTIQPFLRSLYEFAVVLDFQFTFFAYDPFDFEVLKVNFDHTFFLSDSDFAVSSLLKFDGIFDCLKETRLASAISSKYSNKPGEVVCFDLLDSLEIFDVGVGDSL